MVGQGESENQPIAQSSSQESAVLSANEGHRIISATNNPANPPTIHLFDFHKPAIKP